MSAGGHAGAQTLIRGKHIELVWSERQVSPFLLGKQVELLQKFKSFVDLK